MLVHALQAVLVHALQAVLVYALQAVLVLVHALQHQSTPDASSSKMQWLPLLHEPIAGCI